MEFTPFEGVTQYINKDELISTIGDENIYRRFCSDFPKDVCKRPWPGETDDNPSFGFFHNGSKWLWKDLARDDAGDVFQFVQKMFCVSFKDALQLIAKAFNIQSTGGLVMPQMPRIIITDKEGHAKPDAERIIIEVVDRPLTDYDYQLWNTWFVSPNAMADLKIKAADEIWFRAPDKENFIIWARYLESNPVYYWSHPFTSHVKCYKPREKDKQRKWLNNCDNFKDVQGYIQCRIKEYPGKPLLLTSSMKEVGFFRSFGINAMAGHTEGSKFSKDFIRHLYKYCWPILTAYDADTAGVKAAMFLRKEYNIPLLPVCNANHKSKDQTDLWAEDYHECLNYINRVKEAIKYYAINQRSPRSINTAEPVCTTGESGEAACNCS